MSAAQWGEQRTELEAALGFGIDYELLQQALTHRSYAYENGNLPTNERLEFLGDSVLGIVVTETLYRTLPDYPEGELAKVRSAVVNSRALADVARTIDLGRWLLLGKGEESTGGRNKASILADTFEALLGAIYLDRGIEIASTVVHGFFDPVIRAAVDLGAGLDWKTSLQELSAATGSGPPEYRISGDGPDHAKTFVADAIFGGEVYGSGTGSSKKEAEQKAAEQAWRVMKDRADAAAAAAEAEAAKEPAAGA